MVEMYQHTIGILETKIASKKILEIGSAKGYFLALLKGIGWDVFGVEISKAASSFSRNKLKVPTWTGQLEKYIQKSEDKFPVVLAMDIIEHVTDPNYFLACANRALVSGGLLIIGTPNANSINIETQKQHWPGFNPFHIYLFNPENLSRLLQRNGFEIDFYYTYDNKKMLENERHKAPLSWRNNGKVLLKTAGLMSFIKSIRLQWWQLLDTTKRHDYLFKASHNVSNAVNYFDTEDGKSTFAKTAQGDNLVIIARKK
ncbi:class I SAM-dependent methyltransferase [bacterium]|nr:class I SAM-dependent methyltransferase [bacterium]